MSSADKTSKIKIKQSSNALRALAEAKSRKETQVKKEITKEIGGTKGLEPTRYGDWEKKGITSDF